MADVDDLLKELEGALGGTSNAGSSSTPKVPVGGITAPGRVAVPPISSANPSLTAKRSTDTSAVDDLLAMIDDAKVPTKSARVATSAPLYSSLGDTGGKQTPTASADAVSSARGEASGAGRPTKCSTVHLAPAISAGYEVGPPKLGGPKRACSNLLCTACDFSVLRFEDKEWSKDVDYMFFRNYMPSRDQLSRELLSSIGAGCASYCCQCSWVTITKDDGLIGFRKAGAPPMALTSVEHGIVGGNGWFAWSCAGH